MTPAELEGIPIPFEQMFGQLESDILSDIVRRIKVAGEITSSADWQITRLEQLGMSKAEIRAAIQTTLSLTDKTIDALYDSALAREYTNNASLYAPSGYVRTPGTDQEFKALLDALKEQTKGEMRNITRSMGFVTKQNGLLQAEDLTAYMQRTMDEAVNGILTGSFDYNTAIKKAASDMSNSGLRWIDYDSGYHSRVNVAARRAVMTGFNQAMGKMHEDTAKAIGTEHFEVSWHSGARPDHMLWQGRVYSKQDLERICGLGTVAGLCGANCYHDYLPFVPGISARTYSDKQLDEMNAADMKPRTYNGKEYTAYEAKQRQRSLETSMRAYKTKAKLLEEGGANEEDIIDARARYRVTSHEYVQFSKAVGLPQQRERVALDGLGIRKKSAKVGNSIEIDEITPCLRRVSDGKIVQTSVQPISPTRTDTKGWEFDWTKPEKDGYNVYALYAEGDSRIQGLVSTQTQKGAVKVGIVEAAPFNSRHNIAFMGAKEYTGVGGHLFAEAVKQSYVAGNQGVVFFQAKTNLIDYYMRELGAELSNPRDRLMMISEEAASQLYGKYY